MEKKEIRKQIREIKKQYTLEDKKRMSASVWQQVEHNEVFLKIINIGTFRMQNRFVIRFLQNLFHRSSSSKNDSSLYFLFTDF